MKSSPDKTDYSDARILADLERVGYLPCVWFPPKEVRELHHLIRYRQQLVRESRNVKLRVGALVREHRVRRAPARRWTLAWLSWVQHDAVLSEQNHWIHAPTPWGDADEGMPFLPNERLE